jgi:hypothetical protein
MRRSVLGLVALFAVPLWAQTADDIVARYIKTTGGIDKINAVKSLRRTGKFTGGGGFEAVVVNENKRPESVREEFQLQGMVGVVAYDGKNAWKIEPWQGKKDPEPLGEEELKSIIEDSDFDGPLVNYQQKGNKIEYLGLDPVEGTDCHKLKVTTKAGDTFFYYMDTDYFVPIKIETKRTVRGELREYETSIGDYKEVNGWYLPYSYETSAKGNSNKQKITYETIVANLDLPDSRFRQPAPPGSKEPQAPDASQAPPKKPAEKQPPTATPAKPPAGGAQ